MSDTDDLGEGPVDSAGRIFLVVADDTKEMDRALRFACMRARATDGRVALLRVIEPTDFQAWMTVADLISQEQREEAEALLQKLAREVQLLSGKLPILFVREGEPVEELLSLIAEEPSVSVLVLAAGGGEAPGPLVNAITGRALGSLRIPVTLVPAGVAEEVLAVAG